MYRELKGEVESEQNKVKEVTEYSKQSLFTLSDESNQYKEHIQEFLKQLTQYSDLYQEWLVIMNDDQKDLITCNIMYNIDAEYLKCIICNQKNQILNLQTQTNESKKLQVITKDAEVFAVENIETNDVAVQAVDESMIENEKDCVTQIVLDKVLGRIETYKDRNQNPCDSADLLCKDENPYISKVLGMIDLKISALLTEVKEFYETSIMDLHKKYKVEAERQLSFSETSLAKLKYCYEKNLKHIKREHDEKVIRLLAAHEEEVQRMSLYQQNVHSIKEKLNKGKKKKETIALK